MKLFLGGVCIGIIFSIIIAIVFIILWKKKIKSKVDELLLKANLKAIENQKDK